MISSQLAQYSSTERALHWHHRGQGLNFSGVSCQTMSLFTFTALLLLYKLSCDAKLIYCDILDCLLTLSSISAISLFLFFFLFVLSYHTGHYLIFIAYLFNYCQVNIQVSVIDGIVHVNKSKAIHASVTAFHFFAEIGETIIQQDFVVLMMLTFTLELIQVFVEKVCCV